jgi:hypothetical protein
MQTILINLIYAKPATDSLGVIREIQCFLVVTAEEVAVEIQAVGLSPGYSWLQSRTGCMNFPLNFLFSSVSPNSNLDNN